jgi:uncharacterized protein (DUF169 family)
VNPALIVSLVEAIAALTAQVPALVEAFKAHPEVSETERAVVLAKLDAKLQETLDAVVAVKFREP